MEHSAFPFEAVWHEADPSLAAVRLASALAERLDAVVPRPIRVRAEGGWVSLYVGEQPYASIGVAAVLDQEIDSDEKDVERRSFAERAATVVWNALSSAQDTVAETTTEPWPRLPGGSMALPGTRTDGERVFLWYGADHATEAGAVLPLAPVSLVELSGPA